jgi:hypothetical protein
VGIIWTTMKHVLPVRLESTRIKNQIQSVTVYYAIMDILQIWKPSQSAKLVQEGLIRKTVTFHAKYYVTIVQMGFFQVILIQQNVMLAAMECFKILLDKVSAKHALEYTPLLTQDLHLVFCLLELLVLLDFSKVTHYS